MLGPERQRNAAVGGNAAWGRDSYTSVLTTGLKTSGTAFMLWCCFCRWQGYFEIYGKADLRVCMFYISLVPKEVQRLAVNFQAALVLGSLGEKCSKMLVWEVHPI